MLLGFALRCLPYYGSAFHLSLYNRLPLHEPWAGVVSSGTKDPDGCICEISAMVPACRDDSVPAHAGQCTVGSFFNSPRNALRSFAPLKRGDEKDMRRSGSQYSAAFVTKRQLARNGTW